MAHQAPSKRGPRFSRGSELLIEWRGERPAAKVCAELGINEAALYAFLAGRAAPGLRRATRIEKATDGAVPATSWTVLVAAKNSNKRRAA